MPPPQDARTLREIVERLTEAGDGKGEVTVENMLESVGQRSFGPMLLVPGLIVLSPISGIPGVPTLGAIAVLLVAGQMLMGRRSFWLPRFIRTRTVSRARMDKAARFLRPAAGYVDKVVHPRLTALTEPPFNYVIALACVAIALIMPPLEVILFANVATAAAISAFGLSLVAHDGALAILAFAFTAASFYFAIAFFLL